jgi:hypothetical protein
MFGPLTHCDPYNPCFYCIIFSASIEQQYDGEMNFVNSTQNSYGSRHIHTPFVLKFLSLGQQL